MKHLLSPGQAAIKAIRAIRAIIACDRYNLLILTLQCDWCDWLVLVPACSQSQVFLSSPVCLLCCGGGGGGDRQTVSAAILTVTWPVLSHLHSLTPATSRAAHSTPWELNSPNKTPPPPPPQWRTRQPASPRLPPLARRTI